MKPTFAAALERAELELIAETAVGLANQGILTWPEAEIVVDETMRGESARPPGLTPRAYVLAEAHKLRQEFGGPIEGPSLLGLEGGS